MGICFSGKPVPPGSLPPQGATGGMRSPEASESNISKVSAGSSSGPPKSPQGATGGTKSPDTSGVAFAGPAGFDNEDPRITGPYQMPQYFQNTSSGMFKCEVDLRTNKSIAQAFMKEPTPEPENERYTDKGFTLDVAYPEHKRNVNWQRPREIYYNPDLYTHNKAKYACGPTQDRTNKVMSVIAALSEFNENQIYKVLQYGSWDARKGIVTCKFYVLGHWHYVYCDDFLPVVNGSTIWGSLQDDVWVPLLVKCFARLNGSYDAIKNGQFGDIYYTMTGGVVERLDHDRNSIPEKRIFQRISGALASDALVLCCVPVSKQGEDVYLVRLRSCLGGHGDASWKGSWSPGSNEWKEVSHSTLGRVNPAKNEF
ncbi:calpain-1 catalytic subunit-like isoform X2 [Gigantopelta aegis]|uniref:calpain-1 catalytic subunit-like isoform X2 n=1 Tax=Gigantopelta aegis TaxID=1735272 RepID=UPI001B88AF66|nr:calpain-1 catalytic subunit-like isoform X2 [Gigantopelta aegis]